MKEIESRIKFDRETRMKILGKSGGKCCHCGRGLNGQTMTIDHFIPISKGGSNRDENLVALCMDCNKKKDNHNMNTEYYRYLDGITKFELETMREEFNEDLSWLSPKNFLREDVVSLYYEVPAASLSGFKTKKPKEESIYVTKHRAALRKAEYSDLNAIYDYILKYHEKNGLGTDYLYDTLSDIFMKGCIYMLCHGEEIIAVLPFKINVITDSENEQIKYYIMGLNGIICLYQKWYYIELIVNTLHYILGSISLSNDRRCICLDAYIAGHDTFAAKIANALEPIDISGNKEDSFLRYNFVIMFYHTEVDKYLNVTRGKKPSSEQLYAEFSRGLQRVMRLKKLNKEEKSNQKSENNICSRGKQNKNRHEKRMIEELLQETETF